MGRPRPTAVGMGGGWGDWDGESEEGDELKKGQSARKRSERTRLHPGGVGLPG
jgi:hypothetical protein